MKNMGTIENRKTDIGERIRDFFTGYEERYAQALAGDLDVEATASAFADAFIEANPMGVNAGKNDEEFKNQIPKGMEFYRKIGTRTMEVDAVSITTLDDHHHMAKVHWKSVYDKNGKDIKIEFDVIYLLQDIDQMLKIFAYITGDELGVMKEYGLID